jgi:hypothetical protein
MVIENSQVRFHSQTQFTSKHWENSYETLRYTTIDSVEQNTSKEQSSHTLQYVRAVYHYEEHLSLEDRIQKILIEKLLERLGYKKDLPLYPNNKPQRMTQSSLSPLNPYSIQQTSPREQKVMVLQVDELHYQKQSIDFSASAQIQTPNKNFDMNIDLSFSKEFYESRNTQTIIRNNNFIDPLIINYEEDVNPFENISHLHFEFDLDSDGSTEMIPQLKKGAGYLALDKNENGIIDNGNELFGPNTGYGFEELAQYDSDNNNWIDENDDVFNKLKIFSIDEKGQSNLVSLINSNVGAIYLGDIQSGFKYQSAIDKTQAIQKSNGIFIKEDGSGMGVVNSIDVVV